MQAELSQQHYELVLKYMETTNEEDFATAVAALKNDNFNLQAAINRKFGMHEPQHEPQNQAMPDQDQQHQQLRGQLGMPPPLTRRSQEELQKYIRYLREKQNRSLLAGVYNFTKGLVVGLFRGLGQLLLPEFVLKRVLRSAFYNVYRGHVKTEIKDQKLSNLLKNNYLSRKPIMFIISRQTPHECFIRLFNRPQVVRKINQSFIFAGALQNDPQCNAIEGEKQPPAIIICRQNVVEKIEIVRKFVGEGTIVALDVDRLNYALRDHQRAARRDRNLQVKYRNHIRRNYYGGRPGVYQEQEEEEEIYENKSAVVSDMIKQQNQEYQKVEAETRRKQSIELLEREREMEEQRRLQEMEEERKIRKMSIPDEPSEGEIVRINFRCPDGSTKTRNFGSGERVDLIYHWVETNQQIEFQDQAKRQFQLMHGFPPSSLSSRRQHLLKDVFDSDQQKIMIREL